MNLPNVLYISDGEILSQRPQQNARDYLREWQENEGIANGTYIVLLPHHEAQRVEDFLEELRNQASNVPLNPA